MIPNTTTEVKLNQCHPMLLALGGTTREADGKDDQARPDKAEPPLVSARLHALRMSAG
jgi:hypothetical protein